MLASYHNHTTWSDGAASVDDVVARAGALGLGEVGISDHLALPPSGRTPSWSMSADRLHAYAREVLDAADRSRADGGPAVRLGLEVDWFASRAGTLRATLDDLPLDYVIGGVHFFGDVEIDGHASAWQRWTPDERDEVHRDYWCRIREMAASGLFDIAAHLDLPKKFGFLPRGDVQDLVARALDAVAEAPMVVELNTSGWHCPCREPYPSGAILRECRHRDIPVTLSADAHQPADLLRDFAAAAEMLREAGYDRVARFAGRQVRLEPIASAIPE